MFFYHANAKKKKVHFHHLVSGQIDRGLLKFSSVVLKNGSGTEKDPF